MNHLLSYDLEINVSRGALLLDAYWGPEWVDLIDLDHLDILTCEACILGQLYGNYLKGKDKLFPHSIAIADDYNISLLGAHNNGFCYHPRIDKELSDCRDGNDQLTALWRDAILTRRNRSNP